MFKALYSFNITLLLLLSGLNCLVAQVEDPNKEVTINFGAIKNQPKQEENTPPSDYKIKNKNFDISIPELELPEKHSTLLSPKAKSGLGFKSNLDTEGFGELKPKEIEFGKKADTHKYITSQKPRFLKEYEGGKGGVFTDQDLGDVVTRSNYALIRFKDYGQVDGDIIQLIVNDQIKLHRISLQGSFSEIKLQLQDGFNKIDFLALNEGLFAPNTAQLKIIDDNGAILSNNQWALSTGFKATLILIKE